MKEEKRQVCEEIKRLDDIQKVDNEQNFVVSKTKVSQMWWSKNMLTNIVRHLSPQDIIELKLMCTTKRIRAAVFEVLPRLWQHHNSTICEIRKKIQTIDMEYWNYNALSLSRMEQWLVSIEKTDSILISTVMKNLPLENLD